MHLNALALAGLSSEFHSADANLDSLLMHALLSPMQVYMVQKHGLPPPTALFFYFLSRAPLLCPKGHRARCEGRTRPPRLRPWGGVCVGGPSRPASEVSNGLFHLSGWRSPWPSESVADQEAASLHKP